jgi:trans-2-enoyl-CoA reductase
LSFFVYTDICIVFRVFSHELPDPKGDQVLLRLVTAPINPSDINVIEGVYPARPEFTTKWGTAEPSAIAGKEGLFEVVKVGENVESCKVGDWVLPSMASFGTYTTHTLVTAKEVTALAGYKDRVSRIQAATISVNPTSAHQMLQGFVDLKKGDWFIQNGGNSGVGRAAIQLAKVWGFNSINIVRNKPGVDKLKQELVDLGATKVITEDELADRQFQDQIKEWVNEKGGIRLGLNCVGGQSANNIVRVLAEGGHLVTYGSMSRQPISVGAGALIFNDIHLDGFWLQRWSMKNLGVVVKLRLELLDLAAQGKIKEVPVVETEWKESDDDKTIEQKFLKALKDSIEGHGKQVIVM